MEYQEHCYRTSIESDNCQEWHQLTNNRWSNEITCTLLHTNWVCVHRSTSFRCDLPRLPVIVHRTTSMAQSGCPSNATKSTKHTHTPLHWGEQLSSFARIFTRGMSQWTDWNQKDGYLRQTRIVDWQWNKYNHFDQWQWFDVWMVGCNGLEWNRSRLSPWGLSLVTCFPSWALLEWFD